MFNALLVTICNHLQSFMAQSQRFNQYLQKFSRIETVPNPFTGMVLNGKCVEAVPKKKITYTLAIIKIPTLRYSYFHWREIDTDDIYYILMIYENDVYTVDVYRDNRDPESFHAEFHQATHLLPEKVIETVKKLADPKTSLATLFEYHSPVEEKR